MDRSKAIKARRLVRHFLIDVFGADGGIGLCYHERRFYYWEKGCYYEIPEDDIKTKFTRWAQSKNIKHFDNTKRNADEAIHHVKTNVFLSPKVNRNSFIDGSKQGQYVAFENGIVDVAKAVNRQSKVLIVPHTPSFFNVAQIPYAFDRKANCPAWLEIVNHILPNKEDRQLVQQWFGYHLVPGLSRSKLMFFEGSGANGKSVVLLVLRLLLGEANVSSIPLSAFDPDKTFKLAATDGKLANICEEAGQISARVEEVLKQYVNGGVFTVERKFKDPFQMYPSAKITVATNDMPQFRDRSDGIWRRILYIKFGVTIEPRNQRLEFLERDFWLESGELPGILNWALSGAHSLETNKGFLVSERKGDEISSLKMNSDLIRAWVCDRLKEAPGFNQPTSVLLRLMKTDKDAGLLPHISPRELFREIEAQFPRARRPKNAVVIDGERVRVISGVRLAYDTPNTGQV